MTTVSKLGLVKKIFKVGLNEGEFACALETKVKEGRKKVTSSPGVNLVYAVAYFVVSAEHVLRLNN